MSEAQIVFPTVAAPAPVEVAPAPETPANSGLVAFAKSPETRKELVCKDLLRGDLLKAAQAQAVKLYPQMLENTAVFMNYGFSELQGVNDISERLFREGGNKDIDEVNDIVNTLTRNLNGIQRKYDVSDPDVRKKYAEWKGESRHFFGIVRSFVDALMEDVKSLESKIDKVEKQLNGYDQKMLTNVTLYDTLYDLNEQELMKVIVVIAVLELIEAEAEAAANKIVVGDAQLGDRGGEEKARNLQLAENLKQRIADFKGRLFIAWATAPQVRTMRDLDVALASRLRFLVLSTIPQMKQTIALWRLAAQSQQAAKVSQNVADASNATAQAYARAMPGVVETIARTVETPVLAPETVFAMADSIKESANRVALAIQAGNEQRAQLDTAIQQGAKVISDASSVVNDAIVDSLVAKANPLEITRTVLSDQQ